jgi:serine phosphatase RsbU (regulator of sigma subunit)
MATTDVVQAAGATAEKEPPHFECAEVWGGNRPIDGPVYLPGITGHVFSRPCEGGRGGDIHYISICGSGLVSRMCLADVAGHGEAVARVSSEIHALLRRYMDHLDQRRVLSELNQRLEASKLGTMTTAVTITYFPPSRTLSVSFAGHPPPWFYSRAEAGWTRLRPAMTTHREHVPVDLPLAVDPHTTFSRRKQHVVTGDRLLAVTDGVLEAPSPTGELFGEERLEGLLREQRQAGVKELANAIVGAVVAHTGANGLKHDDVSLLVIEFVRGPRVGGGLWLVLKNRLLRGRGA